MGLYLIYRPWERSISKEKKIMTIFKEAWLTIRQRVRAFVYIRGEKKVCQIFNNALCVSLYGLFFVFLIAQIAVGGVPETVTFAASKMMAAIVECKEMCALHCG